MECCLKYNIKLNSAKLQFKLKDVMFMGKIITEKGMKVGSDKVSAMTSMPPLENKSSLPRFIRMANYLSPFCPNLSNNIRTLTMLAQREVPFTWSKTQDDAFQKAKELTTTAPILQPRQAHNTLVDASEIGLGETKMTSGIHF